MMNLMQMEELLLYQTSLNTYQNSCKSIPIKTTNRKTTFKKGVKFIQNTHNVISFEFDDPPSFLEANNEEKP